MSNVIEGRASADGAWLEVDAQHRVPLPSRVEPGTAICVGLRPEHLKVDVGRGEGIPIGKGTLRHAVSDGSVVALTIDWVGCALRANLLAGRGLARSVAPGDRLLLSVRAEDIPPIPRAPAS